jgi:hypothetical protein
MFKLLIIRWRGILKLIILVFIINNRKGRRVYRIKN